MRCGRSLQKRCMPRVGRSKIQPGCLRIREVLGWSGAPVVTQPDDKRPMEVLLTTCKTCDPSPGRLLLRTYLRDPQWLSKESNKIPP